MIDWKFIIDADVSLGYRGWCHVKFRALFARRFPGATAPTVLQIGVEAWFEHLALLHFLTNIQQRHKKIGELTSSCQPVDFLSLIGLFAEYWWTSCARLVVETIDVKRLQAEYGKRMCT